MIEIWEEFARFKTTNQRLANQARIIIKKGCFSDFKILKIHQQINKKTSQLDPIRVTTSLNTKQ